jgi:dinuclear metal center YbgI/SA1388 family protein
MVSTVDLTAYLHTLLQPEKYQDYCPNGLQISGVKSIEHIVTGVSANQALIDAAIQANADSVLVHHGFFWKGEEPCLTGLRYQRCASLIKNDINLMAYHLPLDGHEKLGNNVQLAERLGIKLTGDLLVPEGPGIVRVGRVKQPISGIGFAEHIESVLKRTPLYIPGSSPTITSIAWCTGAAQDFIFLAEKAGVDAFLTGEVSERTVAFAKELGVHFFAAGHHATERYGIQALGDHLASQFKLRHSFIDVDNPV